PRTLRKRPEREAAQWPTRARVTGAYQAPRLHAIRRLASTRSRSIAAAWSQRARSSAGPDATIASTSPSASAVAEREARRPPPRAGRTSTVSPRTEDDLAGEGG